MQEYMRRRLFGLNLIEATFDKRGFESNDKNSQAQLERVGRTFVEGYNAAVEASFPSDLPQTLEQVPLAYRGFAYEGAAMGLAMLDEVFRWRKDRARLFLEGPGAAHAYMVQVGIGLAWAQLRIKPSSRLPRWDKTLGWLAVDGYGFHAGFFNWPKTISGQEKPKHLGPEESRVFDQGLGRSMWFVKGGNVEAIAKTINDFPAERRSDLWAGIGLASCYAGGVPKESLEFLARASGEHFPSLCQGAVFAAAARQRAKNPTEHNDLACQTYFQMSSKQAFDLFETKKREGYEQWRKSIQDCFQNGISDQRSRSA